MAYNFLALVKKGGAIYCVKNKYPQFEFINPTQWHSIVSNNDLEVLNSSNSENYLSVKLKEFGIPSGISAIYSVIPLYHGKYVFHLIQLIVHCHFPPFQSIPFDPSK